MGKIKIKNESTPGTSDSGTTTIYVDTADKHAKTIDDAGVVTDLTSGTDPNAIHDNVAGEIDAVTPKGVPTSSDKILIEDAADSNNKKSITIGDLPDTPPSGSAGGDLGGTYPNPTVDDGADGTAIHDNVAAEINAVTEKVTPISADLLIIEDSADSNNKKKIQIGNLPSSGGGDADAIHDNIAGEIDAVTLKGAPTGSDKLLIEDAADSNNKKSIAISSLPAPTIAHSATTGKTANDHHNQEHALGGADHTAATLAELNALVSDATLDDSGDSRTPSAHASSHQSGGSDAIKLDDLAAPDDNIDLNVSTSAHGLAPKLSNVATQYLDGTGAYSVPAGATAVYGSLSMEGNTTVTAIATQGVPVKLLGTTTSELLQDFTHADNKLTYTGTDTGNFSVNVSATVATTTANDDNIAIHIFKNGSLVGSKVNDTGKKIADNKQCQPSNAALVSLATNDYIEIYLSNDESTDNLTAKNLSLTIISIGGNGADGVQGPQGDQGDTGSGSDIVVKDEGSTVTGGPHSSLNFTGVAVTVTDEGGGQAKVDISGGSPSSWMDRAAFTDNASYVNTSNDFTTDAANAVPIDITHTPNATGVYLITLDVLWSVDTGTFDQEAELVVDDGSVGTATTVRWRYRVEPKDAAGTPDAGGSAGTNQRFPATLRYLHTTTASTAFNIIFRHMPTDDAIESTIKASVLTIERWS